MSSQPVELETQPNERRCASTEETHTLSLPPCCPVTGNPQGGSSVTIRYVPQRCFIEVASLRRYVDSFIGGRGDVRSMEGMVQQIAQDCADAVQTGVMVIGDLFIQPDQRMGLRCSAEPRP